MGRCSGKHFPPRGYYAPPLLRGPFPRRLSSPSTEDEDEEYPSTGTFVTPAGWSIASLYLGERGVDQERSPTGDAERVATSAAEDSAPPTLLKARVAEKILASEKSLVLHATYC